ncbi:hypothetical protein [Nonomuraea sp. NPDC050786]|uniref:hypothetical protein n=1 Tax=Nonomuraea sp. NPDC050786 TaxID=3154840 RepID=UPI0033C2B2A8
MKIRFWLRPKTRQALALAWTAHGCGMARENLTYREDQATGVATVTDAAGVVLGRFCR